MASIIGGIAVSHTPTIGFAVDGRKGEDPDWKPIFEAFAPARAWLDEHRPDAVVVIYNDHVTSFFFDHYSTFALGIGASWHPADEGGGARSLLPIQGDPSLAQHIGFSLSADEFDLSFFQDKPLDHGFFSPMSLLCDPARPWPFAAVPLQVGVLQAPVPSPRRCLKLGRALRRALESYPKDARVAVIATGGLSHQVHGERAGFNNSDWDRDFLRRFENDPEGLAEMSVAELATLGGYEGAEIMMWLILRGALSSQVRKLHEAYYLPSMTGIAVAVYENLAAPPRGEAQRRHRDHVLEQYEGLGALSGTYPFDLARSVKAYRLNKFLHALVEPAHREHFLRDAQGAYRDAGLTAEEIDLVERRDWQGMMHYGVIFFMLEKLGAVIGVSNLHIYAGMRGQPLDRKSTRLNSSHIPLSRMPSSA